MTDEITKDPLDESTSLVKTLRPYHVWALGCRYCAGG